MPGIIKALNYLNIVKSTKEKLPNHSELLSFCDLLTNQLNKIIEIINVSSKINVTNNSKNTKAKNKGKEKDRVIENEVNSSQETYCAVLDNCSADPADTNELGSDINIPPNQNIIIKKIGVSYAIVPQTTKVTVLNEKKSIDKPIDLSSHKPSKSTNDILIQKEQNSQPIDYSSKINKNTNYDKSKPTDTTSKISKLIFEPSDKINIQTKPEINSCPIITNLSKPNEDNNQSYSEQSVFRKPLNYKPKQNKKRKQVTQKSQIVQISNETIKTDPKKVLDKIKIDKTKINNAIQMKAPNTRSGLLSNNAIQKSKTIYNIIKNPVQHQFTIHFNATPQNSQKTSENILDTEETYSSEDCFDDIFADNNQATDTDTSLMMLDLKYKKLNINENSENTTIISEVEENTDWTIDSPIVQIQREPRQTNEPSNNEPSNNEPSNTEEELQDKIKEIKSQEHFKYDGNESVVTNIRNYRKTFVRKILQLRDVMQGTTVKPQHRQNFNSLFKTTTKDGSSADIIKSQYVCPPSPKTERYKAVETFVNRENESDEEFIKRLKNKSRELSGISIQELLQKMGNYSRL